MFLLLRGHRKSIAAYGFWLLCATFVTVVQATDVRPDPAAQAWIQTALDRWENVCHRHLRLPVEPLAWVIFYDDNYAWHLSAEKDLLPAYETAAVTLNFAGKARELLRVTHNEGLWVPGRNERLPLKATVSTMPYANEQKTFCIIPLPSKFRQLAPADQAAALDELFLGLAMHELTHTRQLLFVMAQIHKLRKIYTLPEQLNDNLLEDTFGQNKEYAQLFNQEMDAFGDALFAESLTECKRELARAFAVIQQRKTRYLVGEKKAYAPLDEIFLALEGAAMWAQYQMVRDHVPAGENIQTTLTNLAQRMNACSQVEGLVLFLLMDRLIPNWQALYFAPNPPSPFAALQASLRQKMPAMKKRKR